MRKLSAVVVQSAKAVFHDMIPVALLSVLGALVLVPFVFLLPVGLSLLLLPFVFVPLCAGALYATERRMKGERARVSALFAGAWKFLRPSAVFGLFCSLLLLIVVSTWWYYGGKSGTLYFALAVFQTYFVAMVFVSQLYALPLVVRERIGVFTAMGRSVKLFLAHPGYTVGAFIQLLSLTLLLGVTIVGFGCLFFGMYGVYAHLATANLFAKPEEEDGEDGSGEPREMAVRSAGERSGSHRLEAAPGMGSRR